MDEKTFNKLSNRKYKKLNNCQLPGCDKPIGLEFRKYCTYEHFIQAKTLYRHEWVKRHKDNVKAWNRRYTKNRRIRINNGELIINKKYEPQTEGKVSEENEQN